MIGGVAAGERVVDPALAADTLRDGISPLTARERDVLIAARPGSTVSDIAQKLFLSEGTVRNYLSSAIAKTDLMTFYGPIRFDATGKNVAKSVVLYQVQNGKYRVVAPAKWANAKAIYPAPAWNKR